jgi:D-glycero-alpha-D-manno-heptose-7-phosphate kinase
LPPFFEHKYCTVYSKIEYCQSIDEIVHPAVREVLRFVGQERGVEIHHDGDLPARSGMGSSSAFTVGLLHAMHALHGRITHKKQLATEGIHLEQNVLKETVGSQDQVLAAYGGLNHVVFQPGGDISVRPVTITQDRMRELNSHLLLFYTGIKRTAASVAQTFVAGIDERKRQLRLMRDLVEEGISVLSSDQCITQFGELLDEAWQAKRSLSAHVSNPEVDDLYARAQAAGAVGGKLTGAGGGGFLLLFAEPDKHAHIQEALSNLIHVPFKFEAAGSQIIFYDQEVDYVDAERSRAGKSLAAFRELVI